MGVKAGRRWREGVGGRGSGARRALAVAGQARFGWVRKASHAVKTGAGAAARSRDDVRPVMLRFPLLLALLLFCGNALGQDLALSAALDFSQVYRPGAWQAVRLEFRNQTNRAIDGTAV